MKTIVLQSYRTSDVPTWMAACMASVRAWSQSRGWAYAFMDDAFLALAPAWARERCAGNPYAVTDICRLVWLKRMLDRGWACTVWADADLLVFAPDSLDIPIGRGHGFARELFLQVAADGRALPIHGINNALMAFERGDNMLDAYLAACYAHLRVLAPGPEPRTALGPAILAELATQHDLRLIERVGLFTLAMMQDLAGGGGTHAREYLRLSATAPAAANLCHFMRNATRAADRPRFDAIYNRAVELLLATRGGVIAGAP